MEIPSGAPEPRYNIAPTERVSVVRNRGDARQLEQVRWGLIPSWAKDAKIGSRMINARAETLLEKPAFRTAFERRRCLVLADGFYEWRKEGARRMPYYLRLEPPRPFAFAGLWEVWRPSRDAEWVVSCTIVTTEPNDLVAPLHDRMPVILPEEAHREWLAPGEVDALELERWLKPFRAGEMTCYAVTPAVNKAGEDSPEYIVPLG